MSAHRYVDVNNSAAILADVALEVNLREPVTCAPPPSANKAAYSGFKTQMKHHQKCKIGYQWSHKKDLCPTKILKKEKGYDRIPKCLT